MRVSMSSSAPVSSPTEIICTTIGGKTPDSRNGAVNGDNYTRMTNYIAATLAACSAVETRA